MRRTKIKCATAAAILAFSLAGASAAEKAPSPCKGIAEAACKVETNCSWVKARKAKTGKEIAGFCRSKPGKKAKVAPGAASKG
jgi:hypothetical protein